MSIGMCMQVAYGAFLWNAERPVLLYCIVLNLPIRLTLCFHYREEYVLLSLSTLPQQHKQYVCGNYAAIYLLCCL